VSADALEALAASATMALRAILAPPRHCRGCGAELPYLGGRGRPRRWCDAHHPRPVRLRPRAPHGAGVALWPRPWPRPWPSTGRARAGTRGLRVGWRRRYSACL